MDGDAVSSTETGVCSIENQLPHRGTEGKRTVATNGGAGSALSNEERAAVGTTRFVDEDKSANKRWLEEQPNCVSVAVRRCRSVRSRCLPSHRSQQRTVIYCGFLDMRHAYLEIKTSSSSSFVCFSNAAETEKSKSISPQCVSREDSTRDASEQR